MHHGKENEPQVDTRHISSGLETSEISSVNSSVVFQPSNFWNGFHKMESRCFRSNLEDSNIEQAIPHSPKFIEKDQILSQHEKFNLVTSYVEKGHQRGIESMDLGMKTASSKKFDLKTSRGEIADEGDEVQGELLFHKKSESIQYSKDIAYSIGHGNCFFDFQNSGSKIGAVNPLSPTFNSSKMKLQHFYSPRAMSSDKNEGFFKESMMVANTPTGDSQNRQQPYFFHEQLKMEVINEEAEIAKKEPLNILLSTSNIDLRMREPVPLALKRESHQNSSIDEETYQMKENETSLLRPIQNIREHQGLRMSQINGEILTGLKRFSRESNSSSGKENESLKADSLKPKTIEYNRSQNITAENSLKVIEIEDPNMQTHLIKEDSSFGSSEITLKDQPQKPVSFARSSSRMEKVAECIEKNLPDVHKNVESPSHSAMPLINKTSIESQSQDAINYDMFQSVQQTVPQGFNDQEGRRQTDPLVNRIQKAHAPQMIDIESIKNSNYSDTSQKHAVKSEPISLFRNDRRTQGNSITSKTQTSDSGQISMSGLKLQNQSLLSKSYNMDREPLQTIDEGPEDTKNYDIADIAHSEKTNSNPRLFAQGQQPYFITREAISTQDIPYQNREVIFQNQDNPRLIYSNFSMSINIDNNDFIQHLNKFQCWEKTSANDLFKESTLRDPLKNDSFASLNQLTNNVFDPSPGMRGQDLLAESKNRAVMGTYFDEEIRTNNKTQKSCNDIQSFDGYGTNPFGMESMDNEKFRKGLQVASELNLTSEFAKKSEIYSVSDNKSKNMHNDQMNSNITTKDIALPFSFVRAEIDSFKNEELGNSSVQRPKFSFSIGDHRILLPQVADGNEAETQDFNANIQSFRNSKFCNGTPIEPKQFLSNKSKLSFMKFEPNKMSIEAENQPPELQPQNYPDKVSFLKPLVRPFSIENHPESPSKKTTQGNLECLQAETNFGLGQRMSEDNIKASSKSLNLVRSPGSTSHSKLPIDILWQSIQLDDKAVKAKLFKNQKKTLITDAVTENEIYLNELFEKKNQLLSLKGQLLEFSFENQMTEDEKREFKHGLETIDFEIQELSKKISITMQVLKTVTSNQGSSKNAPKEYSSSPNRPRQGISNRAVIKIESKFQKPVNNRDLSKKNSRISSENSITKTNAKNVSSISKIKPQYNEYFAEHSNEKPRAVLKNGQNSINRSKQSIDIKKSTSLSSQKGSIKLSRPLDSLKSKAIYNTNEKQKLVNRSKANQITPFKSEEYFEKISRQFKSQNNNNLTLTSQSNHSIDKDSFRFALSRNMDTSSISKIRDELKECTFAPKKIAAPLPVSGSFEERNSNWEKSKAQRLQSKLSDKFKREMSEKGPFKPEINPTSRIIAQQKPQSFHERQKIALEKKREHEKPDSVRKTPLSVPLFEKELREMQVLLEHAKKGLLI